MSKHEEQHPGYCYVYETDGTVVDIVAADQERADAMLAKAGFTVNEPVAVKDVQLIHV